MVRRDRCHSVLLSRSRQDHKDELTSPVAGAEVGLSELLWAAATAAKTAARKVLENMLTDGCVDYVYYWVADEGEGEGIIKRKRGTKKSDWGCKRAAEGTKVFGVVYKLRAEADVERIERREKVAEQVTADYIGIGRAIRGFGPRVQSARPVPAVAPAFPSALHQ
jgi:hypothetical protein